jgi:NAD(P)H-flavin reductase
MAGSDSAGGSPVVPRVFRVNRVKRELADTFTFELHSEDGAEDQPFGPGQFNMLYAFAAGEIPISVSGDPLQQDTLVHTIRSVGPVSRALCVLKKGASVGVRGPYGTGWPVDTVRGRDIILIAGGIGLAPLRPVVYVIGSRREEYGRVWLLAGARTPKDLLFARELERWRKKLRIDVQVAVDSAGPDWHGHIGFVTTLIARARFDPSNTSIMICGPELMMRNAARDFVHRGVDREQIYLSIERNMKCALGFCGHCQFGPEFICKDGPVFPYSRLERLLRIREV